MIILTDNQTLKVVLAAAVTTNEAVLYAAFVDHVAGNFGPNSSSGETNGDTAVDWIADPPSGTYRQAKYLSLYNADTVAIDATISVEDGANDRVLFTVTLEPGKTLEYVDCQGFKTATSGSSGVFKLGEAADYSPGELLGPISVGDILFVYDVTDDVPLFTNLSLGTTVLSNVEAFFDAKVMDEIADATDNPTAITQLNALIAELKDKGFMTP